MLKHMNLYMKLQYRSWVPTLLQSLRSIPSLLSIFLVFESILSVIPGRSSCSPTESDWSAHIRRLVEELVKTWNLDSPAALFSLLDSEKIPEASPSVDGVSPFVWLKVGFCGLFHRDQFQISKGAKRRLGRGDDQKAIFPLMRVV